VTGFWQRLFSERVYALGGAIRDYQAPLTAPEAGLAETMVPARRAEFVAGRTLARRALEAIGATAVPLLRDTSGAPCWPPGVTGSITHVRDGEIACCAVAVSSRATVLGIGLDAERCEPLPPRLRPKILTDREAATLGEPAATTPVWADRLLFSAKECIYKSVYPLNGRFLDFHDVEVEVDFAGGAFTACIRHSTSDEYNFGSIIGRFATDGVLLATGVELDRVHITQPPQGGTMAMPQGHRAQ
jgi:4'-phosphopantetheinyl transferase EntD